MEARLRLVLLVLLYTFASSIAPAAQSKAAKRPPNIVFLFADDLGYGDIGPFGSKTNRTPNLDRMAREGLKLTNFYAAPYCTMARAEVITGCYAKRVSLPQVLHPVSRIGLNSAETTVAELLKERGYATICIGKWHLGDQAQFLPTRHGFDEFFGLPYSNDAGGPLQTIAAETARKHRETRPPLPLLHNEVVLEALLPVQQDSLTERYTNEAIRFIRAHQDEPFFLYLPHTAVHTPLHPGANFQGKSEHGTYSDCVEELDWSVGRVLDTLRELDLAENTLVLFSSDNGPWLKQGGAGGSSGPLRGGKGATHEGGVRVPTIAWWPGTVAARTVSDSVVGTIDCLPTFVDIAGGALPNDLFIDGRSFESLLVGRDSASPREAHYYFASNEMHAVRVGPWKLVIAEARPNTNLPAPAFEPELYQLDEDVGETRNVAAAHPEVVAHLQTFVQRMDADLGLVELGPGVRPPGRVSEAVGLWLEGQAPPPRPLLSTLALGDSLDRFDAPQVAKRGFTLSCRVESKTANGVIVAHGGAASGYALHLKDGALTFTISERGAPISIVAKEIPTGRFHISAILASDGTMTLAIDGATVANGKAPGVLARQPNGDFCVGHDNGLAVGAYEGPAPFAGTIEELALLLD